MTEEEWLTATDFQALVAFASERISRRKMLLFACVVAETAISDPTTLEGEALELVERYADGALAPEMATEADLLVMRGRLQREHWWAERYRLAVAARLLDVACSAAPAAFRDEMFGLLIECNWAQVWDQPDKEGEISVDRVFLASRLRDIAGNPFRPAAARPEWLVWNDGQVPRLARAIYDERRYGELPYLADALEDAGCDDDAILSHLRGGGPHVRGCWAMDLLAGLG